MIKIQQINLWRKQHPLLFPIAVFMLLALLAGILEEQSEMGPKIGVLKIEGPIFESDKIIAKIDDLRSREDVKGVILRVDSPGGGAAVSQEIYQELLKLGEEKTLYASIGSVGASGGYYVALAAEQIYALPASLTGSIGVIMQSFNAQGLLEKIGIQPITLTAGKNKDMGSAMRPMKPEERQLLEALLQSTHEQFIEALVVSRKIPKDQISNVADGRIFTGDQAKKAGLVDELGGFAEAYEAICLELKLPSDTELYHPEDPMEEFFSEFAAQSMLTLFGPHSQGGLLYQTTLTTK